MSTRHNLFVSLYLALKKRFASQGFTIVEMMVVVALIGFLSAISVSLISLLFQSNIRAAQSANQQNSIEVFYGFLASKLSYVDDEEMGLPAGDGSNPLSVIPASLSKDQMLFTFRDDLLNTTCYRIMYFKDRQEIRVADYQGKTCFQALGSIGSNLRGPNERLSGANTTSDGYATKDNSRFDPAIDSASEGWSTAGLSAADQEAASFALVTGVRDGSGYNDSDSNSGNNWPLSYPAGYSKAPLELFSYWKQDSGSLGVNEITRTSPLNITGLGSIKIQTFNSAANGINENAIVADRFYEQRFYIGQLCPFPTTGSGGSTPTSDTGSNSQGNVLPAKGWTISGGTEGNAAAFGSSLFDSGAANSWSVSGGDEISIPGGGNTGVYTITVNACFADNADDIGAFEVRKGTEVIMKGAGSFANLPADGRCLSLTKTLSFATADLQVFATAGNINSGDISIVWQSKDN